MQRKDGIIINKIVDELKMNIEKIISENKE